jgi:hypothetical protein
VSTIVDRDVVEEEDISLTPAVLPVSTGLWLFRGDGTCTPVLPTPVVCSATILLSSVLALSVVEAGTSCRSSVVALGGSRTRCVGWV